MSSKLTSNDIERIVKDILKSTVADEYYELKYMEDMVDLFLNLKDITKSYGSQLFHEKNRTSNDLFHFLFSYIEEFEYIEEEDSNDIIFHEVD